MKIGFSSIWRVAWPAILTNLLISSVGLYYLRLVSDAGTDAIAAVTAGHRVFVLLQAMLMGLAVATTARVAASWGRKQAQRSSVWTWQSLYLSWILSAIVFLLVFWQGEAVAALFGLKAAGAEALHGYLTVLLAFNVFHATGVILSAAFRATGDSRTPMLFTLGSTIVNLILSTILVDTQLPSGRVMGVYGVALAGGVALLLAFSLFYLRWRSDRYAFAGGERPAINTNDTAALVRTGIPAAMEQLAIHGSLVVFMIYVGFYGTEAFAAFGVAISLLAILIVVAYGYGVAGAAASGQRYARRELGSVRLVVARTAILSVSSLSVLAILFIAYSDVIARALLENDYVAAITAPYFRYLAPILPLMAAENAVTGALRGMGDTGFTLRSTVAGIAVRLLAGGVVVWFEYPVEWLFSTLFLDYLVKLFLVSRRLWRLTSEAADAHDS